MLEVANLHKQFDSLVAVNNLSFKVGDGELVGLIGPNGAGKTTVFNLISGVLKPDKGRVYLDSRDITRKSIHEIASLGLARTFQQNMLIGEHTCREHIRVASYLVEKYNPLQFSLSLGMQAGSEEGFDRRAEDILDLMGLRQDANRLVDSLPHGTKKILGVTSAYSTNPRFLLMDEPAAGMSLRDIESLKLLMRQLVDRGVSILLIEHNLGLVVDICQRIMVLDFGSLIAEGTPAEVLANESVARAYIGTLL